MLSLKEKVFCVILVVIAAAAKANELYLGYTIFGVSTHKITYAFYIILFICYLWIIKTRARQ
jgi:hypothetical protein